MNKDKISSLTEKFKASYLTKLVKGKTVIIVGPNTNLIGKGLGKYVDSFDLVIRINTVFDFLPFTEDYKKDFGSKTDILYFSPSCIKKYAFKVSTLITLKKNMVKLVVYQNGNKERKYLTGDYCFPKAIDWFKRNLPRVGVKLHYSHSSTYALTKMLNDKKDASSPLIVPRTGFIPILDMIIHKAKTIKTIGMSFTEGGGHTFRPDAVKSMSPLKTHKGLDSPHDSYVEVQLAEDFMKEYSFFSFT